MSAGPVSAAPDLLIRNVRPMGGPAADILIRGGRIADGTAADRAASAAEGTAVLDGGGRIALPGLVEAHTHLDKSLLGTPWYRNEVGTAPDRQDRQRAGGPPRPADRPAAQSARQAMQSVAHGTTHHPHAMSTSTPNAASPASRACWRPGRSSADWSTIDIVAFPQSGLLVRPGTLALLEQALRLGAETVGGLDPCAIDRDPKGHLDACSAWRNASAGAWTSTCTRPARWALFSTDLIIERTRALGMAGRVMISHAFCLGMPDPAIVDPLIAALADAGIAIMTTGARSRPAPPVKRLVEAGVVVCAGSDGIRDTWGPYGNADMLERATLRGPAQQPPPRRRAAAGAGAS